MTMTNWKNVHIQIVSVVMAKKFARHQTIHSSLKKQVDHLREVPGVSRIIVGPSRGVRHNRPVGSIKIQSNVPTGIRILGYSDRGVSEFYVITSDVPGVRCRIAEGLK